MTIQIYKNPLKEGVVVLLLRIEDHVNVKALEVDWNSITNVESAEWIDTYLRVEFGMYNVQDRNMTRAAILDLLY